MGTVGWVILALGLSLIGPDATTGRRDNDATARMRQLLNQSEGSGQIRRQWHPYWLVDQPSHLTPDRVHGGIGP
jgi:hypothetical protein